MTYCAESGAVMETFVAPFFRIESLAQHVRSFSIGVLCCVFLLLFNLHLKAFKKESTLVL